MSAKVTLDVKGLVLAPGELSRAPGALIQADNVNVEAPGVIRSRNGLARQANGFGGPAWKFLSTKELGNNLLMNFGNASGATGLKYGDGSASATSIGGTVSNAAATRMQGAVSRRNHYLTSDEGVRRVESDLSMMFAGMPKGLALDLTGPTAVLVAPASGTLPYQTQTGNFTVGQVVTGLTSGATGTIVADVDNGVTGYLSLSNIVGTFALTSETITDPITGSAATYDNNVPVGWLADTESTAYRVTWCKKDQQGIIMEGPPSSCTVVYNNARTTGWATGKARNVSCRLLIPKQVMTASTALTTAYFYRLYRAKAAAVSVVPSDDMQLVGEAFLTSGQISAGFVDVVDTAPEGFRAIGDSLYTNQNIGGDIGVGGSGVIQSNDAPPRARDVVLFAECLFYSDLTYLAALEFTILGVVSGTGLTAADTLTIGGIVYTAVLESSTPSNNQFRVVGSSTVSENVTRTAQNLVEAINKSTTNTTTWAQYISAEGQLPGKIRIEARTITTAFTAVASAHGTAYRPSLASTVTADIETFANGYTFSKPASGDAVPAVNVGFLGRDDTALLRMQVLRDSIYFFTDSGIYRLTGRDFDSFQVQEFDLSFRLLGRENVVVADDFIYAWGYEGIAKISSAGVEFISNSIEPLVWQIVSNATLSWFASYGWAAAYRSRHKVMFAVPASPSGTNAGNCSAVLVFDTRMKAWTRWIFGIGGDVSRTQGHSCGAVRVSDDFLFMGQWNSYSSDSKVFKERRALTAADYADDTYDGADAAITKNVKWNAMASSPELETHWDELHLLFDVSPTFAGWTTPTAVSATFTSDFALSSTAAAIAPTALSRMSRCLVPRAQRRSARMTVLVSHAVASEYFGLEGMVLVHLSGEGTATVRT